MFDRNITINMDKKIFVPLTIWVQDYEDLYPPAFKTTQIVKERNIPVFFNNSHPHNRTAPTNRPKAPGLPGRLPG